MSWEEIGKRQNEEMLLQFQYTARYYFNLGEKLNYLIWGLCILSASAVFFTFNSNMIFLVDFGAFVLECLMIHCVKKAAKLRNYFDAYVLNLDFGRYNEYDVRELKEIVAKVVKRKNREYQIQISHTGSDKPPGVLNWYEFVPGASDEDAQYECQRKNCWWNEKLFKGRVIVSLVFGVIAAAIFGIICRISGKTANELLSLCLAAFGIKFLERMYVNILYIYLSVKIEGKKEVLAYVRDKQNILDLQKDLDKRREMPVFEMNLIHKCFANSWSKLQTQIFIRCKNGF